MAVNLNTMVINIIYSRVNYKIAEIYFIELMLQALEI